VSSNDLHFTCNTKSRKWTSKEVVFVKISRDDAWHGRAFWIQAVAIGEAWLLTVDSRVQQTGSDDVHADCRRDLIARSAGWNTSWARLEHYSIWKPRWQVCTESIQEFLADVAEEGAEWCGENVKWGHGVDHWLEPMLSWYDGIPAEVMLHNLDVIVPKTLPTTGEWTMTLIDGPWHWPWSIRTMTRIAGPWHRLLDHDTDWWILRNCHSWTL